MSDLPEFLLARIAEDEAAARTMIDNEAWVSDCNEPHDARIEMWDQTDTVRTWLLDGRRVLAECEAKRRIVARKPSLRAHDDVRDVWWDVLALLAVPYASHPDYDERWRV